MDVALEVLDKGGRGRPGDTVTCGTASGITRAQLNVIRARLKSFSSIVRSRLASEPEGNPQPPIQVVPRGECEVVLKPPGRAMSSAAQR